MIPAYDLDGVLATAPPPAPKKWMQMKGRERVQRRIDLLNHYVSAKPILVPEEKEFFVITARKEDVRLETIQWLRDHLPGKTFFIKFFRGGRTIKNVSVFKAGVISEYNIVEFTEDNIRVLKAIRKLLPKLKLYYFDGETRTPV